MRLVEFLARCLAARKMKLIKDPYGVRLPDELWIQAMPEAEFVLGAIQAFDLQEVVQRYHEADEESD
jgi:hypothetical protein